MRAATTPAIPVPGEAPRLAVVAAVGQTVTLRLSIAGMGKQRGRPRHVAGATIFSYVGPAAPASLAQWTVEGNQTRTRFDLHFPPHIKPGSTIWFTARWYNPRAQVGPTCNPIHTNLPGGGVLPLFSHFPLAA